MTRIQFNEVATEFCVVSGSGLFLAGYLWAKISVLPWFVVTN